MNVGQTGGGGAIEFIFGTKKQLSGFAKFTALIGFVMLLICVF